MSKVEVLENAITPTQPSAVTPMDMLDRALATGAGLETVERLMALQERWEANQARKAFVEAFAAFKSEAITIVRTRKVTDGPLRGKSYAELFSFVDAVTPALSKHGLSASWNITRDEKDWIEVTCTIEHILGHTKCVSMGGPPDVGGAKNAIQARASTVTYLERHTLKAACGVSEQGDDADGKTAGNGAAITDEQAAEINRLAIEVKANLAKFLVYMKAESIPAIPAKHYQRAIDALESKRVKS